MSILSDIAKAVRDELNANADNWSTSFTAEFVWTAPEWSKVTNANGLKVYVGGVTETINQEIRSMSTRLYGIKVILFNVCNTDEQIDATDFVREEIVTLLNAHDVLAAYPNAGLVGIANEPVYDAPLLDKNRTFVSVVTLTYKVIS